MDAPSPRRRATSEGTASREASPSDDLVVAAPHPSSLVQGLLGLWGIAHEELPEASALRRSCLESAGGTFQGGLTALPQANPLDTLFAFAAAGQPSAGLRRSQRSGAVYTPRAIAEHIVAEALDLWEPEDRRFEPRLPRVLDPACGSGVFLIASALALRERYALPLATIVGTALRGGDSSPAAVTRARALLEALLLSEGVPVADAVTVAQEAVYVADFLLDDPREAPADIVVGNPPYIKLQDIAPTTREALQATFGPHLRGSYSSALLFLHRMVDRLRPGDVVGLITQNNLFSSVAAAPLRARLHREGLVRRVVDFGHRPVFPGASAYTCLLFLRRSAPAPASFDYAYCSDPSRPNEAPTEALPAAALGAERWRLAYASDRDNVAKLERGGVPLDAIAQIRVGIATLLDRAFLLRPPRRSGDPHCWGKLPLGEPAPVENALTRPLLRLTEIPSEGALRKPSLRVLYPYRSTSHGVTPLPWEDLEAHHPLAARYLRAWEEVLRGRSRGNLPRDGWYLWGRSQGLRAPGPKLLTKTFSRAPAFWLDPSDSLFANGYSLTLLPEARERGWTLEALQVLLNTPILQYYLCLTSIGIAGGYQCYQKKFIAGFHLPSLLPAELAQVPTWSVEEVNACYGCAFGLDLSAIPVALDRHRGLSDTQADPA